MFQKANTYKKPRKGKIIAAATFGSCKEDKHEFKEAEGKADNEPDLYPKLPVVGGIRNSWE